MLNECIVGSQIQMGYHMGYNVQKTWNSLKEFNLGAA